MDVAGDACELLPTVGSCKLSEGLKQRVARLCKEIWTVWIDGPRLIV